MLGERGYEVDGFSVRPPTVQKTWVQSYLEDGVEWLSPQGVGGLLMDPRGRTYVGYLPNGERVDVISLEEAGSKEFGGMLWVGAFRQVKGGNGKGGTATVEHASLEEARCLWTEARRRVEAEKQDPPPVPKSSMLGKNGVGVAKAPDGFVVAKPDAAALASQGWEDWED